MVVTVVRHPHFTYTVWKVCGKWVEPFLPTLKHMMMMYLVYIWFKYYNIYTRRICYRFNYIHEKSTYIDMCGIDRPIVERKFLWTKMFLFNTIFLNTFFSLLCSVTIKPELYQRVFCTCVMRFSFTSFWWKYHIFILFSHSVWFCCCSSSPFIDLVLSGNDAKKSLVAADTAVQVHKYTFYINIICRRFIPCIFHA